MQKNDVVRRYTEENWFTASEVVKFTENGSMNTRVLPAFMKHLKAFVRYFVPEGILYIIFLPRYSSSKGIERLFKAKEHKSEVVISPVNMSNFLQPCDQYANINIQ